MTVIPPVSPSVSIAVSTNNICAGTSVIFTATDTNGGTAPSYQWQLNGVNVGTNGVTFTSATLLNGDVVSCSLTSNATCVTPTSAISNVITINVLSPVTPAISISASSNSICSGTTVTFTAAPKNGGGDPSFQWQLNGNDVGTNSSTYSSTSLLNGDIVSCVMTGDAACTATNSVTSNSITVSVSPGVAAGVTITASSNNICAGIPVIFTATSTNGGGTPSFLWLVNGAEVGGGSTFTSSTLQNGDSVSCIMTGSLACSLAAVAPAIYMVVYPLPTVAFNPDTVYVIANSGVQLTPIITGIITQYLWSPPDGLSNSTIGEPIANPASSTLYQLTATTGEGCSANSTILISPSLPLLMPDAFTPNSDGHNDIFRIPPGIGLTLEEFEIFNKWGTRVFAANNINTGWDGTYKGELSEVGVYVYFIKGKTLEGKPVFLKGTVTLIR
jgi:gliding motility-associated-like protein